VLGFSWRFVNLRADGVGWWFNRHLIFVETAHETAAERWPANRQQKRVTHCGVALNAQQLGRANGAIDASQSDTETTAANTAQANK
jgi:transposase